MTADSILPPPTRDRRGLDDPLAELMRDGEFPTAQADEASTTPSREVPERGRQPRRGRRRAILALLALDVTAIAALATWPLDALPRDPRAPPRGAAAFAVRDQGLVEQALAQAAAGRFDAAIADLELHLATHPDLAEIERQGVHRALAIFAARAGREAEGSAFEARLGDRGAAEAMLAQALAAERAGRADAMRAALRAIVARGDAPPTILSKVAEMLLRAGDGTPLEASHPDAEDR